MPTTDELPRSDSVLSDFCLDRLFDPEDLYYVPLNELVKRYKARDLVPGKIYNIAKKFARDFEKPVRHIIAPKMEKVYKRYMGEENFYKLPKKNYYCSPAIAMKNKLNESDDNENDDKAESRNDGVFSDEEWLRLRKKLRQDLNNMDLSVDYLRRKKNLTEIEKRLLKRMMFIDKEIQTDIEYDKETIGKRSAVKPKIVLPIPVALERIEDLLHEDKWRLVDLFMDLDKNKDWQVSKRDFSREYNRGRLDVDDGMADELMMVYGTEQSTVNYKALNKGRDDHLCERRANLKEAILKKNAEAQNAPNGTLNSTNYIDKSSFQEKKSLNKTLSNRTKLNESNNFVGPLNSTQITDLPVITAKPINTSLNQNPTSATVRYLTVPSADTRTELYPSNLFINTSRSEVSRGQSVPSLFDVRSGSRTSVNYYYSNSKDEMQDVVNSVTQFRTKVKSDYVKLIEKLDQNTSFDRKKLFNALNFPEDTRKSEIVKNLKLKSLSKATINVM